MGRTRYFQNRPKTRKDYISGHLKMNTTAFLKVVQKEN